MILRFLLVVCNPNPSSFSHAIAKTIKDELELKNENKVQIRDLYYDQPRYNPVLEYQELIDSYNQTRIFDDTRQEQELVDEADHLIFVYPVWWWDRPALLKGWFDRTFTPYFAFKPTPYGAKGLLTNKTALVIQTTAARQIDYEFNQAEGVLNRAMKYGTLHYSGIPEIKIQTYYAVTSSKQYRESVLTDVIKVLQQFYSNN